MASIFISYRRSDSGYVASILCERLQNTFGPKSVFIDVDTIPPGVDFRDHISDAVMKCDILLALIGDDWLATEPGTSTRRIDETTDFVRIEIETALSRGIPVVPVLVGSATIPAPEVLPETVRSLVFRNAAEVRSGRNLNLHLDSLVRSLRDHPGLRDRDSSTAAKQKETLSRIQLAVRMRRFAGQLELHYSLVTDTEAPAGEAAIQLDEKLLIRHLGQLETRRLTAAILPNFADGMARMLLPNLVRRWFTNLPDQHLVVMHDKESSRIPWECLRVDGEFPALRQGISRRHLVDGTRSVNTQPLSRSKNTGVLVIINSLQDLPGADAEGNAVYQLFEKWPGTRTQKLQGVEATRAQIMQALKSDAYQVMHVAGHGFVDPRNPASGGVICSAHQVLSGEELQSLVRTPALVFLSVAEPARVRGRNSRSTKRLRVDAPSLAETFVGAGVHEFLAPGWREHDESARLFAEVFYRELLAGSTIGNSVVQARKALWQQLESVDAVSYVHYGDANFVLTGS